MYKIINETNVSFYYKKIRYFLNTNNMINSVGITLIKKLIDSNELKDKLKLLIYSCYRVRCNLFHGPKCIVYLDDQKLLFLSMNELLSVISKAYGM